LRYGTFSLLSLFLSTRPPPTSPLFPYTTLFRSDQRPHLDGCRAEGVAVADRRDRFAELVDELLGHRSVDVDPLHAIARLAAVERLRQPDCVHGEIEIRIVRDNGRTLAAQLEIHLGDIPRRPLHDPGANLGTAGEADHIDTRIDRKSTRLNSSYVK